MRIARTVAEGARWARELPRPVGLVPTMGALHRGHLALVERARAECAGVIATLFVNPLQFGPHEDYARYPRAFDGDVAQLAAAGVALTYAPSVEAMYPPGYATTVEPAGAALRYEGELRPGHFRGVATVCAKLFHVAGADRAYFGAKDAQQVAVLRQLVRDLDLQLEIVVVPTVREADGVALSSRNAYLSPPERAAAPGLFGALRAMAAAARSGATGRAAIVAAGRAALAPPLREAYLDVVDPDTFVPLEPVVPAQPALGIGSVWLGTTRLIDNLAIDVSDGGAESGAERL